MWSNDAALSDCFCVYGIERDTEARDDSTNEPSLAANVP
jgi:hypothetical protein